MKIIDFRNYLRIDYLGKWTLLIYLVFFLILFWHTLDFLSVIRLNIWNAIFYLNSKKFNFYEIYFILHIISSYKIKNYKLIVSNKNLFLFFLKKHYLSNQDKTIKYYQKIFDICEKINLFSNKSIYPKSSRSISTKLNLNIRGEKIEATIEENKKKYFVLKLKSIEKINLYKNKRIKLEYFYINELLTFHSKIKKIKKNDDGTLELELKHSKKIRINNKKKNFRKEFNAPCKLSEAFALKENTENKFFKKNKILYKVKLNDTINANLLSLSKIEALISLKNENQILSGNLLALKIKNKENEFELICKVLERIEENQIIYFRLFFINLNGYEKDLGELLYF